MPYLTEQQGEDLLHAAELGNKLKPSERKQVVLYLERSGKIEKYREDQLAKLLKCRTATVQQYRKDALEVLAQCISTDEAMNIMARYVLWNDILLQEAKAGLSHSQKGTGAHQTYIRIIAELLDSKIDKLQSVGVIPKELGRLTTLKEEWIAEASQDGVVDVRRAEETEAPKEGQ